MSKTENTEATEIIEGKTSKKKKSNAFQPSLFDLQGAQNPLLKEIQETDINLLTPLDALAKIAEWKQKLKG